MRLDPGLNVTAFPDAASGQDGHWFREVGFRGDLIDPLAGYIQHRRDLRGSNEMVSHNCHSNLTHV